MVLLTHLASVVSSRYQEVLCIMSMYYYMYILHANLKQLSVVSAKRRKKIFRKTPPKAAPMLARPRKRLLNTDLKN